MKFKLDENLARECADTLRIAGHDATTVNEQALTGARDEDLAEACQTEGRVLITVDLDLSDIRRYPPEQYAGHIVLRLRNQSRRQQLATMERLAALLDREPIAGKLWIVDESRVRIRSR